jgi:hypothetical protein
MFGIVDNLVRFARAVQNGRQNQCAFHRLIIPGDCYNSSFSVRLASGGGNKMENQAIATAAEPVAEVKPARLLLVDDKPANLLALEALLEDSKHEIVTASSGQEAIASALIDDFALILLDVMMPEMDGFETARHIRETERAGSGVKRRPDFAHRARWGARVRGTGYLAVRNATEGNFLAKKWHSVRFGAGTFRQRLIWR